VQGPRTVTRRWLLSRTDSAECQRERSVSRVLYRPTPERRTVMAIHLRPSVARRLMRPTRGLGNAPLPRPVARRGLRPPIWPCSGWSLPVSLRRPARGRATASSLWHWSSSRDGRVLPATLRCGARTFLAASLRVTPTGAARPSDRLADRWILPSRRGPPLQSEASTQGHTTEASAKAASVRIGASTIRQRPIT
jgi:hypothetical protein